MKWPYFLQTKQRTKRGKKKLPIFQWTIELNYYIEKNINEHIYVQVQVYVYYYYILI